MVYYVGNVPFQNDDLMHYGRLGMRWGQHIFGDEKRMTSAAATGKSRRRRPTKKFRNEVSGLSDDELRKRVNRLNLERQYSQLTGADTRHGAEVAREVLQTTGSIVGIASGVLTVACLLRDLRVANEPF